MLLDNPMHATATARPFGKLGDRVGHAASAAHFGMLPTGLWQRFMRPAGSNNDLVVSVDSD